jgi:SAM-dependent methyltransferase
LQPVSHRFLASATEPEALHEMKLRVCADCALVQAAVPPPPDALRPVFDWISYNEPEAHLDELVTSLAALPGMNPESRIGTIVTGRERTAERFCDRGFLNARRLDLRGDFGILEPNAGTETLQAVLSAGASAKIASPGAFDLLVVRHIVEHAHDVSGLLQGLHRLLKTGGYAVFEVPDCEEALLDCDYSILWEEHVLYFLPSALRGCLERGGFEVLQQLRPRHSLVAVTRKSETAVSPQAVPGCAEQVLRAVSFGESLESTRKAVIAALQRIRRASGRLAFYGAGHMACTWLNLLKLGDQFNFVVDDHPKKKGMFMPGVRLPIIASSEVAGCGVTACVSALSAEAEGSVIAANPEFTARGIRFFSIFPRRHNALLTSS